eukprot:363683-Chlamydomonas_euryale.AAC.2
MNTHSLAFTMYTNDYAGPTDAKSAGDVSCACMKLCRLAWTAATACRAARPGCAPIGAGPIEAKGRTVWPECSPGVG